MNLDKILNLALNKALIGKDRIKQINSNEIADFVNKHLEAINYTRCCKSDSVQLPSKEEMNNRLFDKANQYVKFIYDESYNDPMYQPDVTQSIVDFKAGFNSCVVLLRKAYELIPDGTSHENLIEIKQVLRI